MKKFYFNDYKGQRVAMHCKTEEEANEFCRWKHNNGYKWRDGLFYVDETFFDTYRENSCYLLNDGMVYSVFQCKEDGFEILEMSDFLNPEEDKNNDPVNHPSHYTSGEIECIDAIRASMSHEAFCGFLKGNVIKYLWRYQTKDKPIEDLQKADWYLTKLEEEENK